MGIYAVTGGSSGIGAKTVELLKQKGHKVLNIDLRGGDITADLSKQDGREHVISELHRLCPDGLDGLVCNAGVSGACGNLKLIVSLNFFGTVVLIKGAYDLLIKRGEARLHRCLRYGGAALLRGSLGEEGRKNFRHAVDKRVFRGR